MESTRVVRCSGERLRNASNAGFSDALLECVATSVREARAVSGSRLISGRSLAAMESVRATAVVIRVRVVVAGVIAPVVV